ncbi:MAG: hypothetical protein QM662_12955 [Gordonia sp. (in: high G+C Gram-positive bacteria)]
MPITLADQFVSFTFPEVDPDSTLSVAVMRTLRVPDDNKQHQLPPGFGRFPLRRVDDLPADRIPPTWHRHGGVVLPMWQAEAAWLLFSVTGHCRFLMKVACGGINAVTGERYTTTPDFAAEDYFEVPEQPWLDGFCTAQGAVRQFVAMPLGQGYTVEEQLTGKAEHGGIQIAVWPLRREVHAEREAARLNAILSAGHDDEPGGPPAVAAGAPPMGALPTGAPAGMGMGMGGSITQSITTPVEPHDNWDLTLGKQLAVHIANSTSWQAITGTEPPTRPPAAADYARAGLPWFRWYDETAARPGSSTFGTVASVSTLGTRRRESPLPENETFEPPEPVIVSP